MLKDGSVNTFILASNQLNSLIQALQQAGYQVIGPTLVDEVIAYQPIHSEDDLPLGWGDQQDRGHYRLKQRQDKARFGYNLGADSWKKFLHPPRRPLWQAQKTATGIQFEQVIEEPAPLALLGVRSCELHAIAIQDQVFRSGQHPNEDYQRRRQAVFTVAVNCTQAAATCFCSSMNTGPAVSLDCDLEMTEVIERDQHYFLLRSGSEKGEAIIGQLPLNPARDEHCQQEKSAIERAELQMLAGPRHFSSNNLKTLLYNSYDSPIWDDIADRCLSCANCTMVCPTCFCTTVEDTTDLSGENAQRWEQWDSCFTADFSYIHGGSVRSGTRSRYRQWMTHKLATWHDQFGTSGCVGCGRCVTWCPTGIDITAEVVRFQEAESP